MLNAKTIYRVVTAWCFTLGVCIVMFCCTGCFSHGTWDDLGKSEVILPEYSMRFALSPDGDGIVFSGRQKTAHYCWPLIHCIDNNRGHSKYTWNTYKTVEKRVSLDDLTPGHWRQAPRPYRENLVRFRLLVELDPTAPLSLPEDDMTPYFETMVERVEARVAPADNTADADWSRRYVNPGETIRLRIHPDDLPLLSERPPAASQPDGKRAAGVERSSPGLSGRARRRPLRDAGLSWGGVPRHLLLERRYGPGIDRVLRLVLESHLDARGHRRRRDRPAGLPDRTCHPLAAAMTEGKPFIRSFLSALHLPAPVGCFRKKNVFRG